MAGYDLYTGDYSDEQSRVTYYLNLFSNVRSRRVNFEVMWEESAALVWPEYRNSFSFGHVRFPGQKYTEYQVDSKGSIASHRFMSIADTLITPWSIVWSEMRVSDPALRKSRRVREYENEFNRVLWQERYEPNANFIGSAQVNYQALGVFGGQGMYVDALDTQPGGFSPGLRYIPMQPGELYVLMNHQGRNDGFIRHFRWSARQAYQRWGDKIPDQLKAALEKNSQDLFDFLHFCLPNTDYRPWEVFSDRGKRWNSCYISMAGRCIVEEGGHRTFPLAYGRYSQAPEEDYGRGPAQQVLAELKTANAQKSAFLTQGALAAAPAYLLPGDDSLSFEFHSRAMNYGGMTDEGRPLVGTVPTGEIQITEKMMQMSAGIIDDAFLVSLYPLLFDPNSGRQRSAREVVEMANEKGMFLAPTLGRQFSEYLAPMHMREIDLLHYLKKMPALPPELREARGQYRNTIRFTGPLARAMRSAPIAGFMRTVEMASNIIQAGGDPGTMDLFDFEVAFPEIAEDQMVPVRWMTPPDKLNQRRRARAQSQDQERYVRSLPGLAAMEKAKAISAKANAGMNIGGALSGTPQGGMPVVPGNNPGMPGQPGVFGGPGQPGRPG